MADMSQQGLGPLCDCVAIREAWYGKHLRSPCCVQTSDKAVLEEFEEPADEKAAVTEVVSRAVSPATEVGGDARLILPDERRIKSEVAEHDGLVRRLPTVTLAVL